jgi:hypothetical protein
MLPYENFNYVGIEDSYNDDIKGDQIVIVVGVGKNNVKIKADPKKIYSFSYKKADDILFYDVSQSSFYDRNQTKEIEINNTMKLIYEEMKNKENFLKMFDESFLSVHQFLTKQNNPIVYYIHMNESNIEETIQLMDLIEADFIYFHNLYFNELSWNKIYSFQDYFEKRQVLGYISHGIIQATKDQTNAAGDFFYLKEKIKEWNENKNEENEFPGKFLTVVCNQLLDDSSAIRYLDLVLQTPIGFSPAGSPIANVVDTEYDSEEIHHFYEAGILCYKNKYNFGAVAASATCAIQENESPSKHLSNVMIVKDILNKIKEIQNVYIGYFNIDEAAEEIEIQINQILEEYKSKQILRNYDVSISYERIRGIVYCNLELIPIFAVRKITQFSQLRVRV